MVCLIEYLYWKSTGKPMICKPDECRFRGCESCHKKENTQEDKKENR